MLMFAFAWTCVIIAYALAGCVLLSSAAAGYCILLAVWRGACLLWGQAADYRRLVRLSRNAAIVLVLAILILIQAVGKDIPCLLLAAFAGMMFFLARVVVNSFEPAQ